MRRRRSECGRSPVRRSRSTAARTSRCSSRAAAATRTSAACSPPPMRERGVPVAKTGNHCRPRFRSSSIVELRRASSACPAARATASAFANPNGATRLAEAFGRERFFVELQRPYERGDARRSAHLRDLAEHLGVETVATGDVARASPEAHAAPGRPRCDPLPNLARRVRAGAARKPGELPPCSPRRCSSASPSTARQPSEASSSPAGSSST